MGNICTETDNKNLVLTRVLNSISNAQGQVLWGDFLGAFISTWNLFSVLPPEVRCEPKIKAYEKTMEKIQLQVKGLGTFYSNKEGAQFLIDWTSRNIKTILEKMKRQETKMIRWGLFCVLKKMRFLQSMF